MVKVGFNAILLLQSFHFSYIDSEDELGNVCDRRDGRPYANSYTTTNSDDSDFEKYLDEAIDNIDNDMNIYPSKVILMSKFGFRARVQIELKEFFFFHQ